MRVASGVVMAAVALAATWLGGWFFAVLWLAASVAIFAEWIGLAGVRPRAALVMLGAVGLGALVVAARLVPSPGVAAAIALAALATIATVARGGEARLWAAAGLAYAAIVAIVPVLLRDRADLGAAAILWVFAVVWATDIAAYFVGRAVGGPKLAPRISPGKTWSGFAGGLAAAVAAGAAVASVAARAGLALPLGAASLAAAAAAASVASQAGDLAESAMKRRFGAKDSGRLIPGHGGVFDRLDGFAAVTLLAGLALAGERMATQPGGGP